MARPDRLVLTGAVWLFRIFFVGAFFVLAFLVEPCFLAVLVEGLGLAAAAAFRTVCFLADDFFAGDAFFFLVNGPFLEAAFFLVDDFFAGDFFGAAAFVLVVFFTVFFLYVVFLAILVLVLVTSLEGSGSTTATCV